MGLVLNPILKILSRPVVCVPLKDLEINIYLFLRFAIQVYSRGIEVLHLDLMSLDLLLVVLVLLNLVDMDMFMDMDAAVNEGSGNYYL